MVNWTLHFGPCSVSRLVIKVEPAVQFRAFGADRVAALPVHSLQEHLASFASASVSGCASASASGCAAAAAGCRRCWRWWWCSLVLVDHTQGGSSGSFISLRKRLLQPLLQRGLRAFAADANGDALLRQLLHVQPRNARNPTITTRLRRRRRCHRNLQIEH